MNNNGGDRKSLAYKIAKYGIEEGTKMFNEQSSHYSKMLKGRVSPRKGAVVSQQTKDKVKATLRLSEYHNSIRGKSFDEIYGPSRRKELSRNMKGRVNTIGWFIEVHGRDEGTNKYNARRARIKETTHLREYNKINHNNYSKASQELFWRLHNELKLPDTYFSELNHEHAIGTRRNFDFVVKSNLKIIEFNGDLWHANPAIFSESDTPNPHRKDLTAAQIWAADETKQRAAINKGYQIMVVWYSDYNKDKDKIYEQCRQFLLSI